MIPNYPMEYLAAIEAGDEKPSDKVREVYRREVGWMTHPPEGFPFYFDEEEGYRHIEFIERFCKHSKGKFAGRPVKLELFQKAKIQLVFGWKKYDGLRRFHEVVDVRGRNRDGSSRVGHVAE